MERNSPASSLTEHLSSAILQQLQHFQQVEEIRILAQVTLLDPRYKNRFFSQQEKKKIAVACLNKELRELLEAQHQPKNPEDSSTKDPTSSGAPQKKSHSSELYHQHVQQQQRPSHAAATVLTDTTDMDIINFLAFPWKAL